MTASGWTVLWVALGGATGAVLRYVLDQRVQRATGSAFPWGTLTVNLVGSALLGLLTGWSLATGGTDTARALLGTGLAGALTTFSTFGYETVRLVTERAHAYAAANVVLTVLAGFGAAGGGLALALGVWS
ncbi:fluoride efflux transporter CrcB [Saccharomonospora iraqiensis]|uniref:fluoride efflux transporter CrcB n=1 Tax=Saccharomonospora iraqiensis TaxID=52698 RepID=UPI00040ED985|nr:fluoride efflux transporter CrcB [Saccharomonospora iraqiensis]